jgi:hypothetical protein
MADVEVKNFDSPDETRPFGYNRDITLRPRSNGSERLGCRLRRSCVGRSSGVLRVPLAGALT